MLFVALGLLYCPSLPLLTTTFSSIVRSVSHNTITDTYYSILFLTYLFKSHHFFLPLIFVAATDPFLFRANTSARPPPPNTTSVTTPRYAHNQVQHECHAHARCIYKCPQTYCNFTLSHHSANTATIQMKPASDQINNKSTQALRPSNNDQVNLTSLLHCNAITPILSNVTVAPSQFHCLIIAWMESLT